MLKVACSSPESANQLLTDRIRVDDHLVDVRKDICILIRCIKCQGYGHIQDSCIGIERCTNCASEFHKADTCDRVLACILCGPDSRHLSTSLNCPTFLNKCDALDQQFPENAMPYFLVGDSWTWATAPTTTRDATPTLYFTLPHTFPWSAHEVCGVLVECSWSVHGVFMECSWSAHGVLMDSMECSWSCPYV